MTTREKILLKLNQELERIQRQINLTNELADKLDKLSIDGYFYTDTSVDFDNLSHDKIIEVIKAIGGKWNKTPRDNARIDYETEVSGVKFRCYAGEPPPNCKVVEVLETIPAQPERTVTVRKLLCQ